MIFLCKKVNLNFGSIFCFFFSLILIATPLHANEFFPSVWAWKITGNNRTVYLMGEFHQFEGERSFTIDHSLGIALYGISNEIWTEVEQKSPNSLRSINLYQHITATTQMAVETGIKSVVSDIVNKNDQQRIYGNLVDKLKTSDPFDAYVNLSVMASFRNREKNRNSLGHKGFLLTLKSIENKNKLKKLFDIEKNTSLADAWWKYCDNDKDAETLVAAAVKSFGENNNVPKSSVQELQQIFFASDSNIKLFHDVFLNRDEGSVFDKCIIKPRNHDWLPKIISSLTTDGPPISFLVGMAHIGGEEGLLALLEKAGFTDIKRIYSVK